MKEILEKMLYPDGIKCIACDDELPHFAESGMCTRCMSPLNVRHCARCGRGFFRVKQLEGTNQKQQAAQALCHECQSYDLHFNKAAAPFIYQGSIKHIVHRFKFANAAYLAKYMAHYMIKTLTEKGWDVDLITFAPLTKRRNKTRGYNQAQMLAQQIGDHCGIKVVGILKKIKENKPIAKRTRQKRFKLVKGSIATEDGVSLNGQRVLLVDDVFTSGATAGECALQLKNAGASMVYVLTYATSKTSVKL